MNQINPKKLLNSKWTKVLPTNNEKHFLISKVKNISGKDKIVLKVYKLIFIIRCLLFNQYSHFIKKYLFISSF